MYESILKTFIKDKAFEQAVDANSTKSMKRLLKLCTRGKYRTNAIYSAAAEAVKMLRSCNNSSQIGVYSLKIFISPY